MPITTADCKTFLADFAKATPSLVLSIYGHDEMDKEAADRLIADATNPAKWKRRHKCKPGGGIYAFDAYSIFAKGTPVGRIGYDRVQQAPASAFVAERGFTLDPDTYDSGVAFVVLEDAQGQLHLGDYIGD